jgi:hypothetical protein
MSVERSGLVHAELVNLTPHALHVAALANRCGPSRAAIGPSVEILIAHSP